MSTTGTSTPLAGEQASQLAAVYSASEPLQLDTTYCLISTAWWKHWVAYTGWGRPAGEPLGNIEVPGPIENEPLLLKDEGTAQVRSAPDEIAALKEGLREGPDFAVVSEAAWDLLHAWYGGGPPIRRPTVKEGGMGGRASEVQLELTLLKLHVHLESDDAAAAKRAADHPLVLQLSRGATIAKAVETVCARWELDAAKARLWDYYNRRRYTLLSETGKALSESKLYMGQDILLEMQTRTGGWQHSDDGGDGASGMDLFGESGGTGGSSSGVSGGGGSSSWGGARSSLSTREDTVVDSAKPSVAGVVGLTNLGNTCFMNSMLQCLSNVPPLRTFFVDGAFETDLNPDNPLGAEGQLAESFASLLRLVWGNKASVVSPRHFKHILGRFAPQFAGYGQQDSQELCNYVLDKLHEDVNRIKRKPYVENFEAKDGESDGFIAEEVARRHRLRNDSRIAELFEGFFKSTVVCPHCQRVSVTFDPFMSMAVPMPVAETRSLAVALRRYDGTIAMMRLAVPISGTVKDVIAAVASTASPPVAHTDLVCVEVYSCKLQAIYTAASKLDKIHAGDFVFVYQTAPPPPRALGVPLAAAAAADSDGASNLSSPVTVPAASPPHEASDEAEAALLVVVVQRAPPSVGLSTSSKFIGAPILLTLPKSVTGRALTQTVAQQLARYHRVEGGAPPLERYEPGGDTAEGAASESSADGGAAAAAAATEADSSAQSQTAPRDMQWRLHYSTMSTGSFGYEALGEQVPLDDERPCEFALPGRGGSSTIAASASDAPKLESRHVVIEWQPAAFAARGHYERSRVEADEADKASIGCGRQPPGEPRGGGGGVVLNACLELFAREETLDSDNAWYCDKCQAHREATKKLQIWSVPPVLVVHLKRFSAQGMWRRKNDTHVDFPFEIDLAPHVLCPGGTSTLYKLQAVSNHYGSTGGGHYTAFARNSERGCWYKFDDSHTSQVEPADVVTPAAYVLIYVRQGVDVEAPTLPA